MKFCLLTTSFPVNSAKSRGGDAAYAEMLAKLMKDKGHEVHVIAYEMNDIDDFTNENSIEIHKCITKYIPYASTILPNIFQAWQIFTFYRKLDSKIGFDVVEGSNNEGLMIWIALFARHKFSMRLHSSLKQHILSKGNSFSYKHRFNVWLDKLAARVTRHLSTHTEAHSKEMRKEYSLENRHVELIPHTVSVKQAFLQSCNDKAAPVTIGYIGSLDKRKGIDVLLKSVPIVLSEYPDTQFRIVGIDRGEAPGGGKYEDWYNNNIIKDKETRDRTEFCGFVSDELMGEVWRSLDILVVPSRYESFGYVVIESFFHKRPVVISDIESLTEVASGAATVFKSEDVEDLASKLIDLLSKKDNWIDLIDAGTQIYNEKYKLGIISNRLEKYFQNIVSNNQK